MANIEQDPLFDDDLPINQGKQERTRKLDGYQSNQAPTQEIESLVDLSQPAQDRVALFLPGQTKPLPLLTDATIVLGRADYRNNLAPDLDLTTYGADSSISRQHAKIFSIGDTFHIKDMGSTNGTWVNEYKLAPYQIFPIRRRDCLRLGNITIIVT